MESLSRNDHWSLGIVCPSSDLVFVCHYLQTTQIQNKIDCTVILQVQHRRYLSIRCEKDTDEEVWLYVVTSRALRPVSETTFIAFIQAAGCHLDQVPREGARASHNAKTRQPIKISKHILRWITSYPWNHKYAVLNVNLYYEIHPLKVSHQNFKKLSILFAYRQLWIQ